MNNIDPILVKVGPAECLAVLAEEATELAQAALKLRRTMDTVKDKNPTSMEAQEALNNVIEELADVQLSWFVLFSPRLEEVTDEINKIIVKKRNRWMDRLGVGYQEKKKDKKERLINFNELLKLAGIGNNTFYKRFRNNLEFRRLVKKNRKWYKGKYMYDEAVLQWLLDNTHGLNREDDDE